MSGHTAGPWEYLDIGEIVAGEDQSVTIAILNFGTASPRVAEVEANAQLIAAAPDLLAALQALRNECSGSPRANMLLPMLFAADAALAKAGAK